ncbi:uncharacterized protein [Eleutherodactylus coqui]|uniref:uncharacterized protein n=1 Tax=Eleutherodactylus coqui TaxID=57060 RepID=UPI003461E4B2
MKEERRVLSWRDEDNSFPWRPVIQEVPVPHVLMGQPNTLQYNISGYYPDALTVSWYKKDKGALESVPVHDTYKTSVTESQRQPDSTYSCTASLLFTPTLKDGESEVICRVDHPSLEGPLERSTGPLRVQGKPKSRKPISVTLGKEEVKCSLVLERFYPRDIQITWDCVSEQETQCCPSTERFTTNMDKSYGVTSDCRIPEKDLKNPNVKVRVMWIHESMDDPGSREMAIRDEGFPWRPVIQEVPVPHVLMGQPNTLQYNISGYYPDALTVSWYKKDKGALESVPVHDKYKTSVTESQRQPDSTYSCTASLLFTPTLKDGESEVICRVDHPSLEGPLERSTGPLRVQGKPKSRKPISVTLGKEEVKCSLVLERFYPRDIQITWVCVSEQETQRCPSTERFTTNMDKSYGVTSDCRIPEKDLKNPNVKVRVMWIHESMDDPGSREMAIRDEDYPYRPAVNIQVPLLYNNSEASLECTVSNCFPDVISGMWIKKDRQTGETDHIAGDGAYRISHHELGRQPNNTYSYKSCLIFTPSVESHQGAEFIFQVEHPSVEHPMQKSTGALQIAGEYQTLHHRGRSNGSPDHPEYFHL